MQIQIFTHYPLLIDTRCLSIRRTKFTMSSNWTLSRRHQLTVLVTREKSVRKVGDVKSLSSDGSSSAVVAEDETDRNAQGNEDLQVGDCLQVWVLDDSLSSLWGRFLFSATPIGSFFVQKVTFGRTKNESRFLYAFCSPDCREVQTTVMATSMGDKERNFKQGQVLCYA